ncbi:golgin-45 [Lycorma delicatula]|uniref:golgin-45 n=1 Tax=Lycorma delicatula TaxID=130591 RepID=UPI003F511759
MSSGVTPVCLQKLEVQKRTEGDGMENADVPGNKEIADVSKEKEVIDGKSNLIDRLIYRPKDLKGASFSPPAIKGQIVHLMPKNVTPIKKEGNFQSVLNGREPKFVPYEPYKAAVKPIIPYEKYKRKKSLKTASVHHNVPEDQARLKESKKHKDYTDSHNSITADSSTMNNDDAEKSPELEAERKAMDEELKRLREENEQLESQLKFQAQVNGELKNLLVAAMGEDLETRVHLLTEDKLQLARALLNSAQKLNTHQEQTEYLAGQCEVWRSKFLASSLMVEDLAKWKAALCQKASELQDTMKHILKERVKVRESLINVHTELTLLCDKFDLTSLKGGRKQSGLKSSNVVDLASEIQKLSLNLRLQLLGDIPSSFIIPDLKGLEATTRAELQAEQLLLHPLALLGQPDAACSAVLGAAVALGAGQTYCTPAPACCSHCSGEIKLM